MLKFSKRRQTGMRQRWAPLVVAVACAWPAPHGVVAATPRWPDTPYTYFANGTALAAVLREFASGFALGLQIAPGIEGTVSGRFSSPSPDEFLSRLAAMHGFQWYLQANVLHIVKASDNVVRSLPIPAGVGPVRLLLMELGVLDPRFGWTEIPSQATVMVSGPAGYVDRLEEALRQLPSTNVTQQVNVYRLRYASAEDRVINFRDQRLAQPGLARVLRQLMLGDASLSGPLTVGEKPTGPGTLPVLPAALPLGDVRPGIPAANGDPTGPTAAGGAGAQILGGTAAARRAARASAPPAAPIPVAAQGTVTASTLQVGGDGRLRAPSIQTDPRLNALIIQDVPERMPIYERLIAELDVPTPLIEIEALIIDINSDRAQELGINWALQADGVTVGLGPTSAQPQRGTIGLQLGSLSSTLSALEGSRLLSQIRVLESRGEARIQSRPSVLTLDNLDALLDLSETFYVRVMGERFASVSPVSAGTSLRVTPRLIAGPETAFQMAIDIEDGQIQERQVDTLPTVRRSTVSTQAIVKHSESLLIAGYSTDVDSTSVQKVPVLGDLPVVGTLFTTRSKTLLKRERLFLIRPKLVGLGVPPTASAPVTPPAPAGRARPGTVRR